MMRKAERLRANLSLVQEVMIRWNLQHPDEPPVKHGDELAEIIVTALDQQNRLK